MVVGAISSGKSDVPKRVRSRRVPHADVAETEKCARRPSSPVVRPVRYVGQRRFVADLVRRLYGERLTGRSEIPSRCALLRIAAIGR
jgi:hypothetical protein